MLRRLGLRVVALGYLDLILLAPLAMVFYRTFQTRAGTGLAGAVRSPTRSTPSR